MYQNIIIAHKKSAELHIPVRKRQKKNNPWETTEICEKRRSPHAAFEENRKTPNPTNIQHVENAKQELDEAYRAEQERYIQERVRVIENAHLNHKARLVWDTVNEILDERILAKGKSEQKIPKNVSSYGKNILKTY